MNRGAYNVRIFLNLTVSNCYGGVAGSISVSYASNDGDNNNNVHTLSNLQISNSSGGTSIGTSTGGTAGSISISYVTNGIGGTNGLGSGCSTGCGRSDNKNNVHTLSNLQITNSSSGNVYGGSAGSISISYVTRNWGENSDNTDTLSNLQISNSLGGTNTGHRDGFSPAQTAGAAWSISVSYYSGIQSNSKNVLILANLQISNSSGGTNTLNGGSAGSISVSYFGGTGNDDNTHTLSNLQISNSSGGTNAANGGTAGSISVSHFSNDGENTNNTCTLVNTEISNSFGGTNAKMGGSGGVAITYQSESANPEYGDTNNTVVIHNVTIKGSNGGDLTQGSGALAIHSLGKTQLPTLRCLQIFSLSLSSLHSAFFTAKSFIFCGTNALITKSSVRRLHCQAEELHLAKQRCTTSFFLWDCQHV